MVKRLHISMVAAMLFMVQFSFAQSRLGNYASYKIHISSGSLLGDLGGKNSVGTDDFSDLDLKGIRPTAGLGLQYNIKNFAFGVHSFAGNFLSSDLYTSHPARFNRQLEVRTFMWETSFYLEYTYYRRGGWLNGLYANVGAAALYFNPQANLNGTWIDLQPLGTEGQNFLPNQTPYSKYVFVLPYSIGYKIPVGRQTLLAFDISFRKSFSDYLDDVSTVYADPALLLEHGGQEAVLLADRSGELYTYNAGMQRGDPTDNDNYFLVGIKIERTFGYSPYFMRQAARGGKKSRRSRRGCNYSNRWISASGKVPHIKGGKAKGGWFNVK